MNFKVLSVTALLVSSLCFSAVSAAEEMPKKPETPKQKELRVEADMNHLFNKSMKMAAGKLGKKMELRPFAIIKKTNGEFAVFGASDTKGNEKMGINAQNASIRKYLIDLVAANQIQASIQVMYATVVPKGEKPRQGLTFEMEHIEGVSLLRFLPVSKIKTKEGEDSGKLLFEIEAVSTTVKPITVFAFAKMQ